MRMLFTDAVCLGSSASIPGRNWAEQRVESMAGQMAPSSPQIMGHTYGQPGGWIYRRLALYCPTHHEGVPPRGDGDLSAGRCPHVHTAQTQRGFLPCRLPPRSL